MTAVHTSISPILHFGKDWTLQEKNVLSHTRVECVRPLWVAILAARTRSACKSSLEAADTIAVNLILGQPIICISHAKY